MLLMSLMTLSMQMLTIRSVLQPNIAAVGTVWMTAADHVKTDDCVLTADLV